MEYNEPKDLKEYYICYFDILGYKDYLKNNPDKHVDFLRRINDAIDKTKKTFLLPNGFELFIEHYALNIEIRIFSDNFLICLEKTDDVQYEKARITLFFLAIANIQRGMIVDYGLFVRGGICTGELSINPDYVFGNGLIKAVDIEENTKFPRIQIQDDFMKQYLYMRSYSEEQAELALQIEKKINDSKDLTEKETKEYADISMKVRLERIIIEIAKHVFYKGYDDVVSLSYMYKLPIEFLEEFGDNSIMEMIGHLINTATDNKPSASASNDLFLHIHKEYIIERLKKYGNYDGITDLSEAVEREKILKKYVWTMKYHNDMSDKYYLPEEHINTEANIDARTMLLRVVVF